jgi:DNA-binding MarR family transcriptional regulator
MLLSRFSHSVSQVMERVVATASNSDMVVLTHLYVHPAQRPRELMAVTGLGRPSAAAVVARLERLGLVQRTFGDSDRRTTLASLTPRGRRHMAELERALEQHVVASRPLVAEAVDLLGCAAGGAVERGADDTMLSLIGRLGEAGAAYEAHLDEDVRALGNRHRAAVNILLAWGRTRPTQLAEALGLSSGGLTYAMDQLEAEGVITRSYGSTDDRRAVYIDLTERGTAFGQSMCAALAATAPQICAALSLLTPAAEPATATATTTAT